MTNYLDEFGMEEAREVELTEDLMPEDRESLQKAMNDCMLIFRAPCDAEPDCIHSAIEILEELHPYLSDTRISDQIGEVIELLQEIAEESVLDFEDAQDGKRTVAAIAEALGIEVSDYDI